MNSLKTFNVLLLHVTFPSLMINCIVCLLTVRQSTKSYQIQLFCHDNNYKHVITEKTYVEHNTKQD